MLEDDTSWPSSGESATDKYFDLMDMIMSGGDNDGLFTVTWETPDSTIAAPQTESINGKVKIDDSRWLPGEHHSRIEGKFELWEDTVN